MTGKGVLTRSRRHLACATYKLRTAWISGFDPGTHELLQVAEALNTEALRLGMMQQNLRTACTVWSLASMLAWQEELRSCS
jgi:hypothetical protein